MMVALSGIKMDSYNFIAACEAYQMQYTLDTTDTIKEQPYDNAANDGVEFCKAWCYDANTNDCVASYWVKEESKYHYFKTMQSPKLLNMISDVSI